MKLSGNLPAVFVVTVLAAGVGVVLWQNFSPSGDEAIVSVTVPKLSPAAQAGKQAYDANCARCHGENAAGSRRGPPLVHDIYNPGHHNDAAFFRAAARGARSHHWRFGDMPPQPQVTREEIAAIVRYVREMQEANGIFFKPHVM